jgi:hypothetical protein
MGADLLELVRALSAVERMRLGSLTGKHHLRVLRELNDALKQHEALRGRLNEQTQPVFKRLLDDVGRCLDKADLEQAGDLLRAAEQVSRLCDDEVLALKLDSCRSLYAYLCRDFEHSIEIQRRTLVRRLAGIKLIDADNSMWAGNFALSLTATGRLREARRVCEAALALGRDSDGAWKTELEVLAGGLTIDLGELKAGLARMQNAGPRAAHVMWNDNPGYLVRGLLWGGMLDFDGAVNTGVERRGKARQLLRFSCWLEDSALIERALHGWVSSAPGDVHTHVPEQDLDTIHARALLAALQGRKSAWKLFEDGLKTLPPHQRSRTTDPFHEAAIAAQLKQHTATPGVARKSVTQAFKLWDAIPEEFSPMFEYTSLACRTAVRTKAPDAARAQKWLADRATTGFAAFANP